jgi:hypothetical protein
MSATGTKPTWLYVRYSVAVGGKAVIEAIAAELNARQIPTPTGAAWSAQAVIRVRRRLGQ